LTLAFGTGANTAVFSVVNAALLRRLPYPQSERIVELWSKTRDSAAVPHVTGPQLKHWREYNTVFTDVAGIWDRYTTNLLGRERAERIVCALVSANYLDVLGVHPLLGCNFAPNADVEGSDSSVAIVTYEAWQGRFGGDPAILDRVVNLGGWSCRVIGVLPPRALPSDQLEVLAPLVLGSMAWEMVPDNPWVGAIARLKPGITPAQAEAEVNTLSKELYSRILPTFRDRLHTNVRTMQTQLAAESKPVILVLSGAVALMLLIVCSNLANLLLARAGARQKEMAVRAALGASRSQLIRLVLTESGVLALLGCSAGIALAAVVIRVSHHLTAGMLPHMMQPQIDWRVLWFSLGLALITSLIFGIVPAWRASCADPSNDLKNTGRGTTAGTRARAQSVFILSEIALTVMLLISAGLFLRSLAKILSSDFGFEPKGALVCDWSVTIGNFYRDENGKDDDDRRRAFDRILLFLRAVVSRLEALPGVEAVGTVTTLPLGTEYWRTHVGLPDRPKEEDRFVALDYVGHHYFQAMGMTLLQGRFFRDAEDIQDGPRVLVVNEAFARNMLRGQDPIGRHLRVNNAEWEVIGVVSNVRHEKLDASAEGHIYGVQANNPVTVGFVIRTRTEPLLLADDVRRIVTSVDANQTVANFRTLEQAVDRSLGERRITLYFVGAFAAVALGLACMGIYGLMAYTVGQRQREFSIRIALGAQSSDVVQLVLRHGLRLALFGIVLGLLGAAASTRLIASRLYGVSVADPFVFMAVAVLIGGAATVAAMVPAWRATRAKPIDALRAD
jgi:predicted permease